ncbi:MAG: hypothetical protein HIU91_16110 [Acidobacteria bacterium]|nr:hypothetical protein [Acidobacteriota bacterium]
MAVLGMTFQHFVTFRPCLVAAKPSDILCAGIGSRTSSIGKNLSLVLTLENLAMVHFIKHYHHVLD